jgi:hypothetical protein
MFAVVGCRMDTGLIYNVLRKGLNFILNCLPFRILFLELLNGEIQHMNTTGQNLAAVASGELPQVKSVSCIIHEYKL